MSVKLIIDQAKIMKTVIDAMVPVDTEVGIQLNQKGFRAQTYNFMTSWLVDAYIPNDAFSNYDMNEEKTIFVSLVDFSNFLRTAKNDDSLEITINEEKSTFGLKLTSNEMEKNFELKLLEKNDFKFRQILDKTFETNSIMDAQVFADAIKAAELGDDKVLFRHSKTGLELKSETKTRSINAKISYSSDKISDVEFSNNAPEISEAIYNLEYLKNIAKVGKAGNPLKFSMTNQAPIRIAFDIDENKGYIAFAVAPFNPEPVG